MIDLRPYQREAIDAVVAGLRRGVRRPAIGLPTGTGKTIIFATVVKGACAKGNRSLILAHRDELLAQARAKTLQVAPELDGQIGIVKAERNETGRLVTIASVQSLHPKRLAEMMRGSGGFEIVVVDECHHAAADSYQALLGGLGCFEDRGPLTIGVSATLQRADDRDLGDTFQEVVYYRDILTMIEGGYLSNVRGLSVHLAQLDLSRVKVSRATGDYQEAAAAEALSDADAPMHVVRAWRVNAPSRKTIVFTPTIALAHEMADEFRGAGVRAAALSGKTPARERASILSLFASGDVQVVCNAQVLTEGFDEPSVDCIVIARPTKSPVMYAQMIGRGTRTYPGKDDCLIMDVVGATRAHTLMTAPKMFGLGDEAPPAGEQEAADEAFDVMGAVRAKQQELQRTGRIVARQVEMFDRQALSWKLAEPGLWCLGMGDSMMTLQVDPTSSTWSVIEYGSRGATRLLRDGLALEMAMGVAEEVARRSGDRAARLVAKDAPWRLRTPTDRQIATLMSLGRDVPGTRGEAKDLIDIEFTRERARASRRRRGR